MRRLSVFSLGTALVFALGACSSGTASSSNNSSPQSSHAVASSSGSNTSSAGQQIEVSELLEHPEKARGLDFMRDVKFPITCPSHESGKNPDLEELKKKGISEKEIALTDDNKAGKPRPRSTESVDSKDKKWTTINESDGSWIYDKRGDEHGEVKADGTWTMKTKSHSAELHADGSWQEITEANYGYGTRQETYVNSDGTYRYIKDREVKVMTCSNGSWIEIFPQEIRVGDRDKEILTEITDRGEIRDKNFSDAQTATPSRVNGYGSPGGGGVVPLQARTVVPSGIRL